MVIADSRDSSAAKGVGCRRIELFGLPIDNWTIREAVDRILQYIDEDRPTHVRFINAACVNIAFRDAAYASVLRKPGLTFADGIGMRIAGYTLGQAIRDNVNGTDLFPELCSTLDRHNKSVFLLGGRPGVAAGVGKWLNERWPSLEIAGIEHGYFDSRRARHIADEVARARPDVLLVGLGVPLQDVWIDEHMEHTGTRVALGVGGLFDFYSGRIPRAPAWMRRLGLEWTYRLYQEPRRMWRRYLIGNLVFLGHVGKAKLNCLFDAKPHTPSCSESEAARVAPSTDRVKCSPI